MYRLTRKLSLRHTIKLKRHGSSFFVASSYGILVTSSPKRPTTEDVAVSGVSGDFAVQLATRLSDWSDGGLLRNSAARLSVCRVVS